MRLRVDIIFILGVLDVDGGERDDGGGGCGG